MSRPAAQYPAKRRTVSGFTLIELAIVTAVIGLLAAGAVAGFGAVRTNTKIKETARVLETAELLLQTFIARNSRLPCPANPAIAPGNAAYGRESRLLPQPPGTPRNCDGSRLIAGTNLYWGTLPALDLGVPMRDALDGWDHQLYYVVTRGASWEESPPTVTALTDGRWTLDDNCCGEIELADRPNGTAGRQVIVNQGVAALISAGPNGSGAYTPTGAQLPQPIATAVAELDNQDADHALVMTDYSESATTPFDDMVRVMTEDDLLMPLARIGDIKTKRALTLERMRRLVDIIYGYAAGDASNQIPDDSDANGVAGTGDGSFPFVEVNVAREDTLDAWGLPFIYRQSLPTEAAVALDSVNREICNPAASARDAADRFFTLYSQTDTRLYIGHTLGEAIGRLNLGPALLPCP